MSYVRVRKEICCCLSSGPVLRDFNGSAGRRCVGYTLAGWAVHKGGFLGSWGTCGCLHTPA